MGVLIDPNITVPLPFAGLSYLDFNLFGTGTQLNGFFGGTYGQLSWQVPRLGRGRMQLAGEAFGIAVHFNDRAFRAGREQYSENIEQRPAHVAVSAIAPLTSRLRARIGYDFDYTAFRRADSTSPAFRVPPDARVQTARLSLEGERGSWNGAIWWSYAWRLGWGPWGFPDEASGESPDEYQRYGATLSRSFVYSPTLVARTDLSAMGGRDLDRFSRYAFGTFDNRLRGYPGSSIRYDHGIVWRSVTAWTVSPRLRIDAFIDMAAVRDPGLTKKLKGFPGLGLAVEAPLPFGILGAVEWGYGPEAIASDGTEGTHSLRVTAYKMF
jgi:hypothetical protein